MFFILTCILFFIVEKKKCVQHFSSISLIMKKSYTAPDRGAALDSEQNCSIFCHSLSQLPEEVTYKDSELPHLLHVEEMELSCASCHSVKEHGKTSITQSVSAIEAIGTISENAVTKVIIIHFFINIDPFSK